MTDEQDEILEDTTSMEEKLEALEEAGESVLREEREIAINRIKEQENETTNI
jgi:hypothetical protein